MGYIRHNAIIVTSWNQDRLALAAFQARSIGLAVLGPSPPTNPNQYVSMLVCPDGSKEGWAESDSGDERRAEFRQWLDSQRHEDGSTPYEWAEIAYGSDDRKAEVVAVAWAQQGE
jgi:hypothetical protein